MTDKTDALEDLIPFAEAVLALRDANTDLERTRRNTEGHKTELFKVQKQLDQAISDRDKASASADAARQAEAAAKRGIEEANKEREVILAKAKIDAQAAYDAQLVQKQSTLKDYDHRIELAQASLDAHDRDIAAAKTQLLEIESQISTLKNRFG